MMTASRHTTLMTVLTLMGCEGLGNDPDVCETSADPHIHVHEMDGMPSLSLVAVEDATDIAATSGPWSNPCTWASGTVPRSGARIIIPEHVTVTVDGVIEEDIKTVGIHGTLRFATDIDTELRVDTIVSMMGGRLEIGTAAQPVQEGASARVVFIDDGEIDEDWDPDRLSRGAILMGATEIHGQHRTHRATLAAHPTAGDDALVLEQTPDGWAAGDTIVIAGTDPEDPESDEVRTILDIDGDTITLDEPLAWDHVAPADDLAVHVAHLSRNVELTSESDEVSRWGHVMFMHTLDVQIHNARFYQLGRTDKQQPLDDWFFPELTAESAEAGPGTNIRGRYAVHFHRGGVSPDTSPAVVSGSVVEDNPGWGYVNHSSNVDFIDNVSYDVVGGAFQTEAGDELGSFVGNIAIRTVNPDYPLFDEETAPVDIREASQDFAFQGDGFWIHGGGVELIDNVATGCSGHGFIYWTEGLREVGTAYDELHHFQVRNIPNGDLLPDLDSIDMWWVPLSAMTDNTTYASAKGFAGYYIHATLFEDIHELTPEYLETVHSTIEGLTIWNVALAGIHMENSERFTFRDVRLVNPGYVDATAINTQSTVGNRTIWEAVSVSGFTTGMIVPTQGNITIRGGTWSNLTDFIIAPPEIEPDRPSDDRDLRFDGITLVDSTYFDPEEILNFELVADAVLDGTWDRVNEEESHRLFLIPDRIVVNSNTLSNQRLYFAEQDPMHVPMPTSRIPDTATGVYPDEIADLTNEALYETLGLTFAGALLPDDAEASSRVAGGYVAPATGEDMDHPGCLFINEVHPEADFFDDFSFYDCWDQEGGIAGTVSAFDHRSQEAE